MSSKNRLALEQEDEISPGEFWISSLDELPIKLWISLPLERGVMGSAGERKARTRVNKRWARPHKLKRTRTGIGDDEHRCPQSRLVRKVEWI